MAAIMIPEQELESSWGMHSAEQLLRPELRVFPERLPPEPVQELVEIYNDIFRMGGETAIYEHLAEEKQSKKGISYAVHGDPANTLILFANPFATDLSANNRFHGQFFHECLRVMNVVGSDGNTPQVLQTASPSRATNIALNPFEHAQLFSGDTRPIAKRISSLVFEELPHTEQVISAGYSCSAFLTPDILMSLSKHRDVLAGFIANPPGVQSESMPSILRKFSHAGEHMKNHLQKSGLELLKPDICDIARKIHSKVQTIGDVVTRPTNLSLWKAFSEGKLLDRVDALHRKLPQVIIEFALGREDPLCSPEVLEPYVISSDYTGVIVENGDHSWGRNLPRSLGDLATGQIARVLDQAPISSLRIAS